MPIFICYDPKKRTTPWTQEKYRSMTNEFAKRRIKHFSISSPSELDEYLALYPNEASSIVFFPSSDSERKYLFSRYEKFNINRIIFSHQDVNVAETNFSYIMSDFYGDMQLAISHLKEKGCKKINLATGPDLNKLKLKAKKYNSRGYNVKIVKIETVFEIKQY